jgi:dTDP-4-amino-4,6-dideoxygalactose transaminase
MSILVTKTHLPPLEEYQKYLEKIWASGWITNNGELVRELEGKLKSFLDVDHFYYASNGTVVLQMAIKALELKGKIITTPFSYVATVNSIIWENCEPVFADIDPNTLCISADSVSELLDDEVSGIIATHVYGIPCEVDKLQQLAQQNGIPVIYDAAHAFGTLYNGKSLLAYGDFSTLSFHATKLFHTVEGGGIVASNADLAHKIRLFRSFGHINEDYFSVGINGKNSEFHAAMGLCLLPKVKEFIRERKRIAELYDHELDLTCIKRPLIPMGTTYNYAYYPIILDSEKTLIKVMQKLVEQDIIPRRYFYPSLNKLPFLNYQACPVSEDISARVMCLPFYPDLPAETVKQIAHIINQQM